MAIFATLFAFIGRFVGRILTTTLGWAPTLLFGRVPQDRQIWLAALTFGSLVWVALLAGVILPSLGTILRGYLLAPSLAATLVLLAVVGTVRQADSFVHRRHDAHIPMIVRPGHYEALVDTIRKALEPDGLVTGRRPGPRILTLPAKLLAAVAGGGVRRLVPDELADLVGPRLMVSVYPSDLALAGQTKPVAEARALVTRDLRSTDAWFTTTREAQEIEDRMASMERDRPIDPAAPIDRCGAPPAHRAAGGVGGPLPPATPARRRRRGRPRPGSGLRTASRDGRARLALRDSAGPALPVRRGPRHGLGQPRRSRHRGPGAAGPPRPRVRRGPAQLPRAPRRRIGRARDSQGLISDSEGTRKPEPRIVLRTRGTVSEVRMDESLLLLMEELVESIEQRDAGDPDAPAWEAQRRIQRLEEELARRVRSDSGQRSGAVAVPDEVLAGMV